MENIGNYSAGKFINIIILLVFLLMLVFGSNHTINEKEVQTSG
ncbi:hypothetical protein OXB_3551 [Bacillus sp. OxB-1]|nr:hypothetical protein [Bacillus sp. OxB-1]BAQ12020.1 hypothetical protein OXB_3551 [Bacillus sp. OxB-1]